MHEPTDAELRAMGQVPLVIIAATRGCGKTTTLRYLIASTCHYADWWINDPEGMHWPRMYFGRATIVQRAEELTYLPRRAPGWVYIIRGEHEGESSAKLALETTHINWAHDEADKDIGKDKPIRRDSGLYRMANRNRQRFVPAYFAYRRAADVWLTMPNNASHAILGYTQGQSDLKRIRDEWGQETVDAVRALPAPDSNPAGVYMIRVKLIGVRRIERVFYPHYVPTPRKVALSA